jgi:hypothetical protein
MCQGQKNPRILPAIRFLSLQNLGGAFPELGGGYVPESGGASPLEFVRFMLYG